MQGSRVPTGLFRKRPRVILDKRFPFAKNLAVGEKGQLIATLEVRSIEMQMDVDGNEMKTTQLLITKAENIDNQDTRV